MPLPALPPPPFEAKVFKINDGDTLDVIEVIIPGSNPENGTPVKVRIRLACIDGPEKNQPGGGDSVAGMQALLPPGTVVKVVPVAPKDRYGRIVGFVFSGRTNVNLEQVITGRAWVYTEYIRTCPQYAQELKKAEAEAKLNRIGLWIEPEPCTPWDWRGNKCVALPDCKPLETTTP